MQTNGIAHTITHAHYSLHFHSTHEMAKFFSAIEYENGKPLKKGIPPSKHVWLIVKKVTLVTCNGFFNWRIQTSYMTSFPESIFTSVC